MAENICLNVYPAADGYVAKFNVTDEMVNKNKTKSSNGIETVIILDRSGSMGQNVERLLQHVIPDALNKLGMNDKDYIHLITFDSTTDYYYRSIEFFKSCNIRARGCTYMAPIFNQLEKVFDFAKKSGKNMRILSVSDGELHDQIQTINSASKLFSVCNGKLNCSSNAIRYLSSSYANPDTRGLSSVLQFNTCSNKNSLIDINYTNPLHDTSEKIVQLFQNDGLDFVIQLESSTKNIMTVPWGTANSSLNLTKGENTFWLNNITDDIKINGEKVNLKLHDKLDISSFGTVLKSKVDYFMKQLKLLKVVGTNDSNNEVKNILTYFQKLESSFNKNDIELSDILKDKGLGARVTFYKELIKKKNRSIVAKMSEIANDDKVSQLNSAQQASYLRSADVSSNSKSLAKRAIKSGLDFDSIAQQEVKNMKNHIAELDNIDDINHYRSFYSLDTTLGGIKAVCELDDDQGTLDEMSACDILQMLNIVGIPCESIVGDFPDPMCYRISRLQLGSFVSISDLMMVLETGNKLVSPYDKREITNVVPFFDDDRIHKFLIKYAPSLLEYTCSIGMRRMIMDISKTYVYTLLAGIWSIVGDIDKDKSDANLDVFTKLVHTFDIAVGNMFSHVVPYLTDQDPYLSYYIGNNGITNMISPFITLGKQNKSENNHRILSALYSYEVYQCTRKIFKGDDAHTKKLELLNKLLGIDFDKYSTPLSDDFEDDIDPNTKEHHSNYYVDNSILDSLLEKMGYIKYCTILPQLLSLSINNKTEEIKQLKPISDSTIEDSLKIDFSVRQFMFYCVVQSLIYDSKVSRVDDDNNKMKILDCGNKAYIENFVTEYVVKQYKNKYASDLGVKSRREHQKLSEDLIDAMVQTTDMNHFIELFKNGLTRNKTFEVISDTYKLGFVGLREKLFDPNTNVPEREEKLRILVLGTDRNDNIVWNHGNVLRMNMRELEDNFNKVNAGELWASVKEIYIQRNLHIYRTGIDGNDLPNRHSHCNGKPSYWAHGYKTLEDFIQNISEAEWNEYKEIHKDCCGVIRYIKNAK